MKMIDFQAVPNPEVAHQAGTVSSVAVTLASLLTGGKLHANTQFVRLGVENADLRYTTQGTTPTATLGRRVPYDSAVMLSRAEAENCKLIRVSTDATVQIMQYRA